MEGDAGQRRVAAVEHGDRVGREELAHGHHHAGRVHAGRAGFAEVRHALLHRLRRSSRGSARGRRCAVRGCVRARTAVEQRGERRLRVGDDRQVDGPVEADRHRVGVDAGSSSACAGSPHIGGMPQPSYSPSRAPTTRTTSASRAGQAGAARSKGWK